MNLSLATKLCRIIDGDTVEVEISTKVKVRLLDCWCPEMRAVGGPEAKQFVEQVLYGKEQVTLNVPLEHVANISNLFTFGRLLAHIGFIDTDGVTKDLSEEIIKAGHGKAIKTMLPINL